MPEYDEMMEEERFWEVVGQMSDGTEFISFDQFNSASEAHGWVSEYNRAALSALWPTVDHYSVRPSQLREGGDPCSFGFTPA